MSTDLFQLPTRARSGAFHVVVESPRDAASKIKWEPELRAFMISRPLPLGFRYPFDWGFVPSTCSADGDPVDAMVLSDAPGYPGLVIACRALGVLQLEQNSRSRGTRIRNDRIIAVPLEAPRSERLRDVADLPERLRRELEHFFVEVVSFEPKDARVLGWGNAEAAEALITGATTAPTAKGGEA
jgi:inorganic pyrophosphatase